MDFQRAKDSSKPSQWSYADQRHWYEFYDTTAHESGSQETCFECWDPSPGAKQSGPKSAKLRKVIQSSGQDDAYPGGSPINFDPPSLVNTTKADFQLAGSFQQNRTGLKL